MWEKKSKDYPPDTPWMHEQVESGKGIIGCEMHEIDGWQERLHVPKAQKQGVLTALWSRLKKREKNG